MTDTIRIETAEDFERFAECVEVAVIAQDSRPYGPATIWVDEDGEWHGIRPVDEDDGPWADLPEATRQTLAMPVEGIAPDGYGDEQSFTAFTVLWSSSPIDGLSTRAREEES